MKVLFVCTENIARSPLAVRLFEAAQGGGLRHEARAVGVASHAPRRLTTRDVAWADLVAVMEEAHREFIRRHWPRHLRKVVVLGVSDDFHPNDAELRQALEEKVREVLARCDQG